jgi:hypothetical protein
MAKIPENRSTLFVKILAVFVALAGLAVMAGWIFDIGFLKSVSPAWISMKFMTAIAFILSGILLYFITRAREGETDKSQIVLFIASLVIILLMGTFFFSSFFGVHTGLEELFIKDPGNTAKTVVPGRPSLPTMLAFLFMGLAGILTMMSVKNLLVKLRILGILIGFIGALAITGYIIGVPVLYYYIPGINSAIALTTAIMLLALGTGLSCL